MLLLVAPFLGAQHACTAVGRSSVDMCAVACAQPRFRSMWERYCRGVQAVVYVVDAADHDALDNAPRRAARAAVQAVALRRGPLPPCGSSPARAPAACMRTCSLFVRTVAESSSNSTVEGNGY